MSASLPDVLSSAQAAELLDCTPETIEEQARARLLPGVKLGRGWMFPRSALLEVLHQRAMAHVRAADAGTPPPGPPASTRPALKMVGAGKRRAARPNPPPLGDPPGTQGAAC